MSDKDLTQFPAGTDLTVSHVAGDGPVANRLREIGMIPGARLRVVRQGSPMIVQLGNSRFCLRGQEAALVKVQTTESVQGAEAKFSPVESPGTCLF